LDKPPTIFISAGEASGEAYGAQLIEAARSFGGASFFGLGGAQMRAAGCEVAVESHEVTVVGLAEVVTHLPRIYSRFRQLLREIDRLKPRAAVLIDFPDFNFRLAKELHKRGIPVVYFVSPQLWAWRQSRLELVKKYVSKMLVIFPFEEQWYRERGVEAEYVGHPLAFCSPQRAQSTATEREEYASKWGVDSNKQWIALLPGSRKGEIARNLGEMVSGAFAMGSSYEYVLPVASTLDRGQLKAVVEGYRGQGGGREFYVPHIHLVHGALEALRYSRAAVVASGTATVEAALVGTPFVVIYRLSGLTWRLGRRMVKLDHFAMPNLIAVRRVVPELIQDDFTAENVVRELNKIIADGPDRERMISGLAEVRAKLTSTGVPPAERAARVLLEVAARL
jgi:lipid-A-disaccharide synthase